MKKCCKDCTDKYSGCHDRCVKYTAACLQSSAEKSVIYENRRKYNYGIDAQIKSVERIKRRKGK